MMKPALFLLVLGIAFANPVEAAKPPKNLKVLSPDLGKKINKGMKALTKGVGMKCTGCHVKGKMDLDDKAEKAATRTFIKATIGEKDPAKRKAALAALLKELKLESAKKEDKIWAAIDMWSPAEK